MQDNAGNLYIMFSIGYHGEWHGEPTNDPMEPYLLKVNQLNFNGWELVNPDVVAGSEGPSMTKLNGRYYPYTDKLHTFGPGSSRGNLVAVADSPYGPWTNLGKIATIGRENRHGTVIRVTDPTAKSKLYALYTGQQGSNPIVDGIKAAMMHLKAFLHLPKVPTLACAGWRCTVDWV